MRSAFCVRIWSRCATDTIEPMLAMIEGLQQRGYAYQAENGDVYFAVSKFADYGKLSGKKIDELRAGERVDIDAGKRDPLDFVLWKSAKPGEPSWSSNFGDGTTRLAYRVFGDVE